MDKKDIENFKKAGEIVKKVKEDIKKWIKKDMLLLEIAEKIESEIIKQGGKLAFPVNLGINEITAHYTPSYDDKTKAHGLLKVDFGVAIDNYAADNSFSIDLENSKENKKLIEASDEALERAIKTVKEGKTLGEIGAEIQKIAEKHGFSPIRNLSGHGIEKGNLHANLTIPNYDNNSTKLLPDGVYAIEPFITTGVGEVRDGKESGIYELRNIKNVRDQKTREILEYISKEYSTLPFCSRWLIKKFGTRALISLKLIEQTGALHQFSQLIEKSKKPVAQSEATIIIEKGNVEVVT